MSGIQDIINRGLWTVLAGFLFGFFAAGALLGLTGYILSWPVGAVGATVFLIWALRVRRKWRRDKLERAPGAPERVVRICAAGTAMLLGHSMALNAIPGLDLRADEARLLVLDSWVLGGSWATAWVFFLKEGRVRDERHAHIVAGGLKAGYGALHILLIPFCLYIAFSPPHLTPEPFVIANLLITVMLAAYLALLTEQLRAYAKDRLYTEDVEPPL